jgi:predicted ATPase/DNA-binding XRE family transcriptional regulator
MQEISFGTWLRKQRRGLDLSRKAFADQAGCAEVTLRRIEAGTLKPSKELAGILLEKLGIPETEKSQWISFARGLSGFPFESNKSSSKPRTNLPAPITTFIGREKQQLEIIQLITKHRLVTLTGSGGVGKTRISIKVGEQVLGNYADGVWLLELASLSDPTLLPQTAAALFGITPQSNIPFTDLLVNFLRAKSVLLILDNCEHLLEVCAYFAATVLQNCPYLKILTTSREPLGIIGEAIYVVPSLALPDLQHLLITFKEFESVRLFEERAQLAQFDFSLTIENASSVAQICHHLDGIPLAIELAAAKVGILSAEQIAKQLDESFSLLAGGSRTALPRQQTLKASIDWSWGLLVEAEQILMRQLSVFVGSWTLEAAQAVCNGDVLGLTNSLVKKSLIALNQGTGSEMRYHFHETIRQYAHEKLIEASEEEAIRAQHLKYFLKLSEQAETGLIGPEQATWYDRLLIERDNIRLALESAVYNDSEAGMLLSTNLGRRFWENFDGREGLSWLTKFLNLQEASVRPKGRAKALYVQAGLLRVLQQLDLARAKAEESLVLCRADGDQRGEIDALLLIGNIREHQDIFYRKEELNEALVLAQSIGDVWRQANGLAELGWIQPDLKHSHAFWEEAISLYRQVGDWLNLVLYLGVLADSLVLDDQIDSARKFLEEVPSLALQLKGKTEMDYVFFAYGHLALIENNFEQARSKFQECAIRAEEVGNRVGYLWANANLGYVALREGNEIEAQSCFVSCLKEFHANKDVEGVEYVLEALAILSLELGNLKQSAQLIGWANATCEKRGYGRPKLEQVDVDKVIAVCSAKLSEAIFSAAYESGRNMSLNEAVAYALEN